MEKRRSISATLDPNHSTYYQTYMAAGRGKIWFWFENFENIEERTERSLL
jgi:hypothetical protein